jgi:hypothetical protein
MVSSRVSNRRPMSSSSFFRNCASTPHFAVVTKLAREAVESAHEREQRLAWSRDARRERLGVRRVEGFIGHAADDTSGAVR